MQPCGPIGAYGQPFARPFSAPPDLSSVRCCWPVSTEPQSKLNCGFPVSAPKARPRLVCPRSASYLNSRLCAGPVLLCFLFGQRPCLWPEAAASHLLFLLWRVQWQSLVAAISPHASLRARDESLPVQIRQPVWKPICLLLCRASPVPAFLSLALCLPVFPAKHDALIPADVALNKSGFHLHRFKGMLDGF